MIRYKIVTLFVVCYFSWIISPLTAHPHIFIEVFPTRGEVIIHDGLIKKLTVVWKFDQMSSMFMQMEYDKNKDGKFDTAEIKAIAQPEFYQKFSPFEYFTFIYDRDDKGVQRKVLMPKAQDFKPSMQRDQVLYEFSFDLSGQAIKAKNSTITFNDEHIFVAFYTEKKYVFISDIKMPFKLYQRESMIGYDLVLE